MSGNPESFRRSRAWRTALVLVVAISATAFGVRAQNAAPTVAVAAAAAGEFGKWVTESGNLEVEIAPCGDALCGTVVRVLANHSMSDAGAEMVAVDDGPVLGMKILRDFTAGGDGRWNGSIYNRENGKIYRCVIELEGADRLRVHGYVGLPLFGKTQIWRRVS